MVLARREDLDVVGMEEDDLEAAFQVFFVRRGRVMGRRGWVVDRVEDLDRARAGRRRSSRSCTWSGDEVPPRVLVPAGPADRDVLETWLAGPAGSRVRIAVPQRGDGRRLLQMVDQNAREAFHAAQAEAGLRLRRPVPGAGRARRRSSGSRRRPLRIECYDISNLGPTDKVASMVVFEDGLPKRTDYRRFEIKGVPGQDDFASMEEVLRRRFARLERGGRRRRAGRPARPRSGRRAPAVRVSRRRWSWSTGAAASCRVAERVAGRRGLWTSRSIGLAKRLEEVYLPGQPEPLVIPRGSEALFVLQHIRDEAHRFAITYHRQKRAKRALRSPLDEIPGVGPTPKEGAAQAVRLAARLRAATVEEIAAAPGRRAGAGPDRSTNTCTAPASAASGSERRAALRRRTAGQAPAAEPASVLRLHDHHRPVGRRPVRGGQVPRGPRLLRRRQPAARR